jgi:hypothetical protein
MCTEGEGGEAHRHVKTDQAVFWFCAWKDPGRTCQSGPMTFIESSKTNCSGTRKNGEERRVGLSLLIVTPSPLDLRAVHVCVSRVHTLCSLAGRLPCAHGPLRARPAQLFPFLRERACLRPLDPPFRFAAHHGCPLFASPGGSLQPR